MHARMQVIYFSVGQFDQSVDEQSKEAPQDQEQRQREAAAGDFRCSSAGAGTLRVGTRTGRAGLNYFRVLHERSEARGADKRE